MKRENHYVPASYLRRWSDAEGVPTYRLLVPHGNCPEWKRYAPKAIAKHRDLYLRVDESDEADEIERWLDEEFESPARDPIERAIQGRRLTKDDWRRLIRFAAVQDVRTPARLVEYMRQWETLLERQMSQSLEYTKSRLEEAQATGAKLEALDDPDGSLFQVAIEDPGDGENVRVRVGVVGGKGLWFYAMKRMLNDPVKLLEEHRWTILHPPSGQLWLTSDDPVVKVNWRREGDFDFDGKWASPGTDIFLPLGPEHLLATRVGHRLHPRGTIVDPTIAIRYQRLTVAHAHRFVFAVQPDDRVSSWRRRTVDGSMVNEERSQWSRWHEQNQEAQRRLRSGEWSEYRGP